jgi:peptidoglycan lytic transglycosylase
VPGRHAKEQQVRSGFSGPVASAAVVAALLLGGAVGAVRLNQERTGATVRADPATTATAAHAPAGAEPTPRANATPAATTPPAATPAATSPAAPPPTASPTPGAQPSPGPERASRGDTRTAAPRPSPSRATVVASGSCGASYYDEPQGTANGETFDPEALTAAHKEWAFNTRVRVTNPDTGRSVVVRINDRGPYIDGRCIDLSRAAFRAIADLDLGEIQVRYEVLK